MASYGPSNTFVVGRFNVWIPNRPQNAFVSFDTAAEAQADVRAHQMGVVLTPQGQADPNLQAWAGWNGFLAQIPRVGPNLNPAMPSAPAMGSPGSSPINATRVAGPAAPAAPPPAAAAPVKGEYSVYIPTAWQPSAQINNAGKQFDQGAYLNFPTLADAQNYTRTRGFGVILDGNGAVDPVQTWNQAATYAPQSSNHRLELTRTAGRFEVWFPGAVAGSLGVANAPKFAAGAFLSFETEAEAVAEAQRRRFGIVLTPTGVYGAAQPSANAKGYWAQSPVTSTEIKPAAVPGKYNVWIPPSHVQSVGGNAQVFPNGIYLPVGTLPEAQAEVQRLGIGVLLNPKGDAEPVQVWNLAGPFIAQSLNGQLTATRTAGQYSVWFPANQWNQLGGANTAQWAQTGAYLAFNTPAEAIAHAKQRNLGVVLDPKGAMDPTQPWPQAATYGAQLLNPLAQPKAPKGEFAVWFPHNYLGTVGVNAQVSPTFTNGAYIPFKTAAEAQAHARARGIGVIVDGNGAVDPVQTWNEAPRFATQLLNDKLTDKQKANTFAVWIPQPFLPQASVTNTAAFPFGAFLAFDTLQEAADHARVRGLGAVVDDKGAIAGAQTWPYANQYAAQLQNSKLKAQRPEGKFSVWFTQQTLPNIGVALNPGSPAAATFKAGAYLAFETLAEAQAHAKLRGQGVILDPAGAVDAAVQTWNLGAATGLQLTNPQLKNQPAAGQFNVWFPQQWLANVGVPNAGDFPGGAFLPFATAAEAQAHARTRGVGVILDGNGAFDAVQTWQTANTFTSQLLNRELTSTRKANAWAVWFPQQFLPQIGVSNPQAFKAGAYLSFATQAEAEAHARLRGQGVILDANGAMDPIQTWQSAGQFRLQLANAELTSKATPGKYNVWFPGPWLQNIGANPAFFTGGAFLAFDSAAQAQAHVQQRNTGVILDEKGAVDATQIWAQAGQFGTQLMNVQLTPARKAGEFSVFFPQAYLGQIGVADAQAFPKGAYLAFPTVKEALTHARLRTIGVVVDEQGRLNSMQPWAQAVNAVANNPEILPAPPSGWVSAPVPVDPANLQRLGAPTAGSVSVGQVTPTKTGADIIAYVATIRPPDQFHFFLGGQINGNWLPIFSVPDLISLPAAGWQQFTLHVDYDAVTAYLQSVNPALGVTPNMNSAIGIRFMSGHDTGIPGWSQNQGTERDAPVALPARA